MLDWPFDPGSLKIVYDAAAGPVPTIKLSDAGSHMSGVLLAVLSQIARSGIAVLADPHACFKECGRTGCARIYLDRSLGARRTACSPMRFLGHAGTSVCVSVEGGTRAPHQAPLSLPALLVDGSESDGYFDE
nr:CGNR zinc finger domain-containing protein [Micromonospora sp. KC606]